MKLKTKKQISLGVLSAVAVISVPIATVVSCGESAPKQNVSLKKNQTTDTQNTKDLKEKIAQLETQLKQLSKQTTSKKPTNSIFGTAKTSIMSVLSDIKNAAVKYFESKKTDADKKILADDVDAARVKTKATMNKLLSGPNSIIDGLLASVNDPKITKYAKILKPFLPLITSMLNTLVDDLFMNIKNAVHYEKPWMAKEVSKVDKDKVLKNLTEAMMTNHGYSKDQWFGNEIAIQTMAYLQEIKKTKEVTPVQAKYFKEISDGWKDHIKTNTWDNDNARHIRAMQAMVVQDVSLDLWELTTLTGSNETDKTRFVNLFETLSKPMTPTEFSKSKLIKSQENDNDKTLDIFIKLTSTVKVLETTEYSNQIHNIILKTPNSKKHVYKDSKGVTKITIDYSVRSLINVFNKMIKYDPWTKGALIDNKAISALVLKVFGKSKSSITQIAGGGGMGSILSLIPALLGDLRNGASTFENNLQPLFSILFGDKGKLIFELKPGDSGKYFNDYKWYSPQLQVFNSEYIYKREKHYITDADKTQFFGALLDLVKKMMMPKP